MNNTTKEIIEDCHYCTYAICDNEYSSVDCFVEDGEYFSHRIKDSKKEAGNCIRFCYDNTFPKY